MDSKTKRKALDRLDTVDVQLRRLRDKLDNLPDMSSDSVARVMEYAVRDNASGLNWQVQALKRYLEDKQA